MRDMLLEAEELAPCRAALGAHKYPVELESGAKIFVRPEHYNPALVAVRLNGLSLYKNHVLVDLDLEDVILRITRQLPGRLSTYPKNRDVVPLGLTQSASSAGFDLAVTRTFIQIHVPTSMYSESDTGAARTASTTYADPRKRSLGRPAGRGGPSGR